MTVVDIKLCNTMLAREREAADSFAEWAKYEVARLRKEAADMILHAEGIEEAAMVLRLKRAPKV